MAELTEADYEYRMDKLFGKGDMWKHRTLRTIFDCGSTEYNKTTMDQKLDYLKTICEKETDLYNLILDYKSRYKEMNKLNVIDSLDQTFCELLSYMLSKDKS